MDFNPKQTLAITKSIIELTDPSGSCGLVERRSKKNDRFNDGIIAFNDKKRRNSLVAMIDHSISTASVNGFELRELCLMRDFSQPHFLASLGCSQHPQRKNHQTVNHKCQASKARRLIPLDSSTST